MRRQSTCVPLLAATLVGACARGVTTEVDVDAVGPASLPAWDGGVADAPLCPGLDRVIAYDRRPADVLLLFDRSGSMVTALGDGTRYSAASGLLGDLVATYQDKLRFGFQQFPAKESCDGAAPGCCADPPIVAVGANEAQPMAAAMAQAAPPSGATPTASALRLARAYFQSLADGVPDRYVLLATDGVPSCGADGHVGETDVFDSNGELTAGPCYDALVEATALAQQGVKLVVVAVGPGGEGDPGGVPGCLDELAQRGGWPRADGNPWYFSASDPDRLEMALQQMFGATAPPSCELELDNPSSDPDEVAVLLDGYAIPRDDVNGWSYAAVSDTRHIIVNGVYCNRIERFQVTSIEVRVACPPGTLVYAPIGRGCRQLL